MIGDDGKEYGIAVDRGCMVVLVPDGSAWTPTTHIPPEVAGKIHDLVESGDWDDQ